MPCCIGLIALSAPRVAILLVVLFSDYIGTAYETTLWPLLGFFFRSTFTLKERQHVLFAISPRIIQRSDFETDL